MIKFEKEPKSKMYQLTQSYPFNEYSVQTRRAQYQYHHLQASVITLFVNTKENVG